LPFRGDWIGPLDLACAAVYAENLSGGLSYIDNGIAAGALDGQGGPIGCDLRTTSSDEKDEQDTDQCGAPLGAT
jgi:hypothetical protein